MDLVKIVMVGHVDHGKSTLIGRLLYDTDSIPDDKINEIREESKRTGKDIEFAFFQDNFKEEREKGITIDIIETFFKTEKREYVIIDAPGHREFLKNMISGATRADAGVLLVDIDEGIKEQTKRHINVLALLGIRNVIVVVNKMDLVGYDREAYLKIEHELGILLKKAKIEVQAYIPASALNGENIKERSSNMPWYGGDTFLENLDSINFYTDDETKDFIFPIQDVYSYDNEKVLVGRVESGKIENFDSVMLMPCGEKVKVAGIKKYNESSSVAYKEECVGIVLDREVSVSRGDVICDGEAGNRENFKDRFKASIFLLEERLRKGEEVKLLLNTQEVKAKIDKIDKIIDSGEMEVRNENTDVLNKLDIGVVTFHVEKDILVKKYSELENLGRFIITKDDKIYAGGIVE